MTLDEFVKAFAAEFDETPEDQFKADTEFKTLEEWGSLTALSIISMVDENMDKTITGADIRASKTIEDLYNLANSK
jgi:acyl carrier protein